MLQRTHIGWILLGWVTLTVALGFAVESQLAYPVGALFFTTISATIAIGVSGLFLLGMKLKQLGFRGFGYLLQGLTAVLLVITLILSVDYRILLFPDARHQPTTEQWKADLDQLRTLVYEEHPNAFHTISRTKWDSAVTALEIQLPELSDTEIRLGIMKLTTLLDDGHTWMPPQPANPLNMLPLNLHWAKDGWIISNATGGYEALIGAEITHIGERSMPEIEAIVDPYISVESDRGKRYRVPWYSMMTELLVKEGVTDQADIVPIRIKQAGQAKTVEVEPIAFWQFILFHLYPEGDGVYDLGDHKLMEPNYSLHYRENEKALEVQLHMMNDDSDVGPITQFAQQIKANLDQTEAEKVIIDLRNNGGGNHYKTRPILDVLEQHPKLQEKGSVYALIGPRTYSAAVNFVTMLENRTPVILVGQPTGQGPTQYGDATNPTLSNSGLFFMLSSRYWQGGLPGDNRQEITPHIALEPTIEDIRNGEDPVMEVAFMDQTKDDTDTSLDLAEIAGRYRLKEDSLLVADIDQDSFGYWRLQVRDFIPKGLRRINTRIMDQRGDTLLTDHRGLKLVDTSDGLALLIPGSNQAEFNLVPETDYIVPMEVIARGEIIAGAEAVTHPERYRSFNIEYHMNQWGYELLNNDRAEEARAIFELITRVYPESYNAWDSLGEAYLHLNQPLKGKASYQKSLELNPDNTNAEHMITRVRRHYEQH